MSIYKEFRGNGPLAIFSARTIVQRLNRIDAKYKAYYEQSPYGNLCVYFTPQSEQEQENRTSIELGRTLLNFNK